MKGWLLLVAAFLLCPSCSSQNEITCSPPRISNGSFRPQRTTYQDGDLIRIQCDHGFNFEADNAEKVVECTRNGWSRSPKCVEITCNPPGIANGSFQPQRTIYQDGDLIQIQCDPGFNFEPHNAEKVVECTRNGWSRSPKCVEITCQADYIEHGTILSVKNIYKEADRIRFSCDEGYTHVDRSDALCTENGWGTKLQCI
ncbi:complement factor H-like, partial [Python bivittatus]|uniref:Complement factor H-like n=1 Tax=Python bivittatus TaxID=176946 RepID=A0A9F5J9R5_PYTBI